MDHNLAGMAVYILAWRDVAWRCLMIFYTSQKPWGMKLRLMRLTINLNDFSKNLQQYNLKKLKESHCIYFTNLQGPWRHIKRTWMNITQTPHIIYSTTKHYHSMSLTLLNVTWEGIWFVFYCVCVCVCVLTLAGWSGEVLGSLFS